MPDSPNEGSGTRGGGYEDISPTVPVQVDPATGIPYATRFQHSIAGSDRGSFGFCFGEYNESFPGKYHLGCDYLSEYAPYGAVVTAPADGIVRISTDIRFGYYGSDSGQNPDNLGCVLVLEHLIPSGQAVTSLMGHVQCESNVTYDPDREQGNPVVGTIARRGQYIGHVAHYWLGSSQTNDVPHIHEGFRRGQFDAASYTRSGLALFVQGYALVSEFTMDELGHKTHPAWIDPIAFVEAHGDPVAFQNGNVLHHPPGSLITNGRGWYWMVVSNTEIAEIPRNVIDADRYDTGRAVIVSDAEIDCYEAADPISSLGDHVLYKRPFTNTIVVAYPDRGERFDIINWEAFLSWGFEQGEIQEDFWDAMYYEWFYNPEGYRTLRPGTLVKGDAETEVSIVTPYGTRIPIFSGSVFEALGFTWDRIVTVPQEVLDDVAGQREGTPFGREALTFCPALPSCADGGTCGGGDGEPPDPEPISTPDPEPVPNPVEPDPIPDPVDPEPDPEPDPVCIPNAQINCDCSDGSLGVQVCLDDASGFGACQCPVAEPDPLPDPVDPLPDPEPDPPDPEPVSDPIPNPVEPDPIPDPVDPEPDPVSSHDSITLLYEGPVTGAYVLMAWWRNPDGSIRGWNIVSECADTNPNDTVLECELSVPSGAQVFEFQINLPDGTYWGDHSCWSGGCDAPIGTVTLTQSGEIVEYTFIPNSSGEPYFNGYLAPVP